MAKSIATTGPIDKPRKPRQDFPLFPHASGRWAKKIRGKFSYFGKVADDPKGQAALQFWLDRRDDLLAGRTPHTGDGLTIRELCNRYLSVKESQVNNREITRRHFENLYAACELVVVQFGKTRLVDDLVSEDFEAFRMSLAKTRGAWALGSVIQKIRSLFKYGYDAGLIDKPMRYGPAFKRPGMAAIRRERMEKGPRTFTAAEIGSLLEIASVQIKAMILLAINCGLGNSDCGQLRHSNIDLARGWLTYPRPKTGIDRRCPLWKETITALRAAIDKRPAPSDTADEELVFLTKYGRPWEIDRMCNPISHEFRKLLNKLDLHRPGLSFYALRHTFATEAGATRDQVAVNAIMGHADQSMAAVYRERIDDDRLRSVTDHVWRWLWPKKQHKPQVVRRRTHTS
jgi:integrase